MTAGAIPDAGGKVVTVRGPAFTRLDWKVVWVTVLMFPALVLLIVFLTIGGPSSNGLAKLIAAGGTDAFLVLLGLELFSYPKLLTLSPRGVSVRTRFRTVTKGWTELDREVLAPVGMYASAGGGVGYSYKILRGSPVRRAGWWFTPDQLRALLRYPSGKVWDIPPSVETILEPNASNRRSTRL